MDKYSFIKEIGQGNYGKVVLVEDKNKLKYAVKLIETTKLSKEEIDKAHAEVQVQSQLKHPFVVQFYESFEYEECVFNKEHLHCNGIRPEWGLPETDQRAQKQEKIVPVDS